MKLSKAYAIIFFIIMLIAGCGQQKEQPAETQQMPVEEGKSAGDLTPSLSMVWETDTVLTTVESVLYDRGSDRIYASSIVGNPTEKDGRGFISILDQRGGIENLEWVNGLNAPKGMAILDAKLYVTDIDRLVEIDLASGDILDTYTIDGAKFLNDVATDGASIYFSDTANGLIHVMTNGRIETYAEGHENVNGLAVGSNGNLLALDADGFHRIGEAGGSISEEMTNGDGLVVIDEDTFIASRWEGEIYLIDEGNSYMLLDSKAQSSNTADIGFIPDGRIILVPTFYKNKVVAYRLTY